MKRKLLSGTILVLLAGMGFTQTCATDPLYADSVFGIWPDTLENFPCVKPGDPYSEDLQFKMPTEASQVDPNQYPPGVPINWIRLDDVSGLPGGISYLTNAAGSAPPDQWDGGTQGCASIFGTAPTTEATHDVVIEVTGEINVGGFISEVPLTFGGYRIVVDANCNTTPGIVKVGEMRFELKQNQPNPFTGSTVINYHSMVSANFDFVVTNLLGEVILSKQVTAGYGNNTIEMSSENLPDGIYTYSLTYGSDVATKRMIVSGN